MAHETGSMSALGRIIEEFCDLDAIIACANNSPCLNRQKNFPVSGKRKRIRATIGVALDDAFCFYYQDNLDRLRDSGADLVFFSPLNGPLPDSDALYLGGGYPELHLPTLESSKSTTQLRSVVDAGMPVYAECGGLMYLSRNVTSDRRYTLSGVLPADVEMTSGIQALGYVKGESIGNVSFFPPSVCITGHEFHYSRMFPDRDAKFLFRLSRGSGIDSGKDGLTSINAIGTYTHAYFNRRFAEIFVDAAHRFSRE
jgi:cobyrinic acid a,c-diamide synthase